MANETSKTSKLLNDQFNTILLIMFLSVVIILTLKGFCSCFSNNQENVAVQVDEKEVINSSMQNDSLTIIH